MTRQMKGFSLFGWLRDKGNRSLSKADAGKNIQLKDFIYLDTPRVESFLSQLQEGLIKELVESESRNVGIDAKLTGGVPWLRANLSSIGSITSIRNTGKILHNYLYTVLEKDLGERVIDIVEAFSIQDWQSGVVHERLGEKQTDFVKIRGRVRIFDFASMVLQLETVSRMIDSFTQVQYASSRTGQAATNPSRQQVNYLGSSRKDERKALEGIEKITTLIKEFYSDFIILKVYPTSDDKYHFIGALDKAYLQDDRARMFLKFGTSSPMNWIVLAQVALVPQPPEAVVAQHSDFSQVSHGQSSDFSEFATALFDSLRTMFAQTGISISVKHPAISITPLTIYRI